MLRIGEYIPRLITCIIIQVSLVFIINGCTTKYDGRLLNIEDNTYEEVKLVDGPNCTAERQKDYFNKVRIKIYSNWKYPYDSVKQYSERILTLFFTVNRSGDVLDINIMESSGVKTLDDAAVQAIKDASPVGMIPECIDNTVTTLKIRGKFVYRLGAIKEIGE